MVTCKGLRYGGVRRDPVLALGSKRSDPVSCSRAVDRGEHYRGYTPVMGKAPAFQFYAAEYLADENVQLLSLQQEGIYIRLLAYCWREGSIPADVAKLSALCKSCSPDALAEVVQLFRAAQLPGRLTHKRLDDERLKQELFRKKQSMNGSKGGRPQGRKTVEEPVGKGLALVGATQDEAKESSSIVFASSSPSSSSTSSKLQKIARGKRESDIRRQKFIRLTAAYWEHKNPTLSMPWDESEGKQLSRFLKANPWLDEPQFERLLESRSQSQANHAERPRAWLGKITDYAGGPLDVYNKPIRGKNEKFSCKTESSVDAANAVIEAIENCAPAEGPRYSAKSQAGDRGLSSVRDGSRVIRIVRH